MDVFGKFMDFYFKHYKVLLFIPLILLLAGFLSIFLKYKEVNDIFDKDVSLKGGISFTLYTQEDIKDLEGYLENKLDADFLIRRLAEFGSDKQLGIVIETSGVREEDLINALEERFGKLSDYSVEETGPTLGTSFYNQMIRGMIFAFIFMSIVVFIIFRNFIPSLYVIFSIVADISITIGVIDFLGLKVSTAGISALLLLIGYSVDTDILLTTNVLKRQEGELEERAGRSIKTGLTMTFATIVAVSVGYLLSSSFVLKEMFIILLIGLFTDIIVTYLFNGPVLFLYMEKKK